MSDFIAAVWAFISGLAGGPVGVFAIAFCGACIFYAVLLIVWHRAATNLNRMPKPESKEDDR